MRKTILAALLAVGMVWAVASIAAPQNAEEQKSAQTTAMNSIDAEKIRAHVRFLSHDLLEGRGTGARGGDIAGEYIATQFALDGLKPAGENGTYMQKVPMVGVRTLPETVFRFLPTKAEPMNVRYLDDYVVSNSTQTQVADIYAPLVFVGFGITAPEYQWDDYKGVDLKGKVAVMFVAEPESNDPNFFKGKALTYYGRWTYKFEEAARRGAVAALVIHRTDLASYPWEVVHNSWGGETAYLQLDGTPKLKAASWIQWDVAKKLVSYAGLSLDQLYKDAQSRSFKPIELPVNLDARVVSALRPFVSSNVVAMLPGSDAKRSGEAVLYTAHYDHLGIDPTLKGDQIYNGAVDNGTGCGILLEMARAFSTVPLETRPARSILFAAVTGEEQGLLGSEYLGKHPPIPAAKISLDLNFDAIYPIGDPEEVEVGGAEKTSVYGLVEETAKQAGLRIQPDAHPEAGHYYRSDHFSLAHEGIPAFSVDEGTKFVGHPAEWGEKQDEDYTAHHYHQPSDEYSPAMDFTSNAKLARFGFALGWKVADLPGLAGWVPGDEFEPARKQSQHELK